MPRPTPFYTRQAPLCESYQWRNWSGYLAPLRYQPTHEREYFAVRDAAGLLDISPLFKYEVQGPDALPLVNRIMTRDFARCRVGQVMYSPWCDEAGKLIHDGNVVRLGESHFRITAADPCLRWFEDCGIGMDVHVRDVSQQIAALALQGPKSRAILREVVQGVDWDGLGYFRAATGRMVDAHGAFPLTVTRTGYTGDLGYELWLDTKAGTDTVPDTVPDTGRAERLWDALMAAGRAHNMLPIGLDALDMLRIEAGLLLIETDYVSAPHALLESQKSSPFEAGLGWAVALDKESFVGQRALQAERRRGSDWRFVGLQVEWFELERLFNPVGLRPGVVGQPASRAPVPIYDPESGAQIGQATSHVFSPLLKTYLALGTIRTDAGIHMSDTAGDTVGGTVGGTVGLEMTVEFRREVARARVVEMPFYAPAWKRK